MLKVPRSLSGASVLAGADTEAIKLAAIEAIKQWKFQPYIENGKPVKVSTNLPLRFAIADDKCTDGMKQAIVTTPFEHKVTATEKEMQGYICKKVPLRIHAWRSLPGLVVTLSWRQQSVKTEWRRVCMF